MVFADFRFAVATVTLILSSSPAWAGDLVLVHAVGNKETIVARDLTKPECNALRDKMIRTGEIKVEGTTEDPRLGTLSCLPASFF